jgi:hypothetical protein
LSVAIQVELAAGFYLSAVRGMTVEKMYSEIQNFWFDIGGMVSI